MYKITHKLHKELYNTKKEVCEALIDYHAEDSDVRDEIDLFEEGHYDECIKLMCEGFNWEVVEIKKLI